MELMDIYNNTKNIIDDKNIIRKFVELYSEPTTRSFYSSLIRANKNTNSCRYFPKEKDGLYSLLFNTWKKNITSMTQEEYIELYKQGQLKEDFIKLRNFLLKTPNISTYEEMQKIIFAQRQDKELEEAFDKYKWSSFGENSGWEHICSRYVHSRREKHQDIEHRLYIRVDSLGIYTICKCFIEECEKQHIPYYFKFDEFNDRDDSLVVYSSTKYLNKYIEILNKIKEEHQELHQFIGKPPLLTASINNWIGYGSEPTCKKENNELYSFNELRADIIEKAIEKNAQSWLKANLNVVINYKGKKVVFSDYLLMKATETYINKISSRYNGSLKFRTELARKENRQFNEKELIEWYGYSQNDLASDNFKNYIYRHLKENKDKYIQALITGDYSGIKNLEIPVRCNKKVSFSKEDMKKTLKTLVPIIAKNEPRFIDHVQTEIKRESSRYSIDANNFAFDSKTVQRMKAYDQQVTKPKEELNDMFKQPIKKPRLRFQNETDEEYERYLREFYGGNSLV